MKNLKITEKDYNFMRQKIEETLKNRGEKYLIHCYESGNINNASKTKNIQTRFNFDLLYAAGLCSFVCNNLYTYLDDTHIESALNHICPKIDKNKFNSAMIRKEIESRGFNTSKIEIISI